MNTPLTRTGVAHLIRTSSTCLLLRAARECFYWRKWPVSIRRERYNVALQYHIEDRVDRWGQARGCHDGTLYRRTHRTSLHALHRFGIKDRKYVFSMDLSGYFFKRMTGRSLRKAYGTKDHKFQQNLWRPTVSFTASQICQSLTRKVEKQIRFCFSKQASALSSDLRLCSNFTRLTAWLLCLIVTFKIDQHRMLTPQICCP